MGKVNKKRLHELFVKIKQEDKEMFDKMYEEYYITVYGICFSMLKNKDNSEDVTQTVFAKLLKMPKENMPVSNETTWLYTVTKNEVLQFLRKRNDDIDLNSVYDLYISDKELEEVVDMDEYYKLLKGLNEKEKEIVSLKVLNDFTFKEIGQMLNMPTATVQWYYYKSINVLKMAVSSMTTFVIAILISMRVFKDKIKVMSIKKENLQEDGHKEYPESIVQDESNAPACESNSNTGSFKENILVKPNCMSDKSSSNSEFYLGVSGILLIISIFFFIFFKKSQQKLRKKVSK